MMDYLSRAQVREIDRRATAEYGIPSLTLMENAGRGCAELMMQLNPEKEPIWVLCGPGNNGGDGYVMARHLHNHDWPVTVCAAITSQDPTRHFDPDCQFPLYSGLPADAYTNYSVLKKMNAIVVGMLLLEDELRFELNAWTESLLLSKCWIVDALFGTGLSRPLSDMVRNYVAIINASRNPILAIDIPSGLDCDTGEPLGPCVKATHTATFVAPKLGFKNPKSKEFTGEVHVIDIGVSQKLIEDVLKASGAA